MLFDGFLIASKLFQLSGMAVNRSSLLDVERGGREGAGRERAREREGEGEREISFASLFNNISTFLG